jgi:hypothetical protein
MRHGRAGRLFAVPQRGVKYPYTVYFVRVRLNGLVRIRRHIPKVLPFARQRAVFDFLLALPPDAAADAACQRLGAAKEKPPAIKRNAGTSAVRQQKLRGQGDNGPGQNSRASLCHRGCSISDAFVIIHEYWISIR